jgi:hypothetical protein
MIKKQHSIINEIKKIPKKSKENHDFVGFVGVVSITHAHTAVMAILPFFLSQSFLPSVWQVELSLSLARYWDSGLVPTIVKKCSILSILYFFLFLDIKV